MPSLEQDIENTKTGIALEKELLKSSLNTVRPENNPFSNFAISLDNAKEDIKYSSPIINSEGNLNLHEDGSYSVVDPVSGYVNKNLTREGALSYQAFNDAYNKAQEYGRTSDPVFDTDNTLGYLGNLGLTGLIETANLVPDVVASPALYARNRFLEDQQFIDLQNEEKKLNTDLQVMNFKLMAQEAQGNVNPERMQQFKDTNNRLNEITRVLDSNSRQASIDPETGQAVFGTTDYSVGGPTNRQRAYTAEKSLEMLNPLFEGLEADKEKRRSLLNKKDELMAEAQVASYAPAIAEKWDEGDYTGVAIDGLTAMYDTIWDNPGASMSLLVGSIPQMALAVKNLPIATTNLYVANKAELLEEFKKNTGAAPTDDQISHIDNMAMLASLADTASDRLLAGGFGQLSKGVAATSKALDIPYRVTKAFVAKIPATLKPLAKPLVELVGQPIQEGISGATTAYAMEAGSKPEGAELDTKKIAEQGILEGVAAGPLVGAQAARATVGSGVGVAKEGTEKLKEKFKKSETPTETFSHPTAKPVDSRITIDSTAANPDSIINIISQEGVPGTTESEVKAVASDILDGIAASNLSEKEQKARFDQTMTLVRKQLAELRGETQKSATEVKNSLKTITEATEAQAKTKEFQRTLGSTIEALTYTDKVAPITVEEARVLASSPYLSNDQLKVVNNYVKRMDEVSTEIEGGDPQYSAWGISDYLENISNYAAIDNQAKVTELLGKFENWGKTHATKYKSFKQAYDEAARLASKSGLEAFLADQEKVNAQNLYYQNKGIPLRIEGKQLKLTDTGNWINITDKTGMNLFKGLRDQVGKELVSMRKAYKAAAELADIKGIKANEEVSTQQPTDQTNQKQAQDTGSSTKTTSEKKESKEIKPVSEMTSQEIKDELKAKRNDSNEKERVAELAAEANKRIKDRRNKEKARGKEKVQEEGKQEKPNEEVTDSKPEVKPEPVKAKPVRKIYIQSQSVTREQAIEAIKPMSIGEGKTRLLKLLSQEQLTTAEYNELNKLLDKKITNNSDILIKDIEEDGTTGITQDAASLLSEYNTFFNKLARLHRSIEEGKC